MTPSRELRIACMQLPARAGEPFAERVEAVLGQAAGIAADVLVLPELWATGFFAFDRYEQDADRRHELLAALGALARRRGGVVVAGSAVERGDQGLHNTTAVFGPGGALVGEYRKLHLFGHGDGEAAILTPGTDPVVCSVAGLRIGLSTCYDLRFPELYRELVDRGAQLIVTTAAWPQARIEHWELLQRARALESQCFAIACNGCGLDRDVELGGRSGVFGPDGEVVALAGAEPTVLRTTIELATVTARREAFPVLEDRRRERPMRVGGAAKYVHTNLVARDWRELARFYVKVFGCEPVPPQRDQRGPWLDRATGLKGARLQGMHLRLPGTGPDGPTLEIYSYDETGARSPAMPNDPGYGHVAFAVEDVSCAVREIVDHGGSTLGEVASTTVAGVGELELIYVRDPEGNIIELQSWRT